MRCPNCGSEEQDMIAQEKKLINDKEENGMELKDTAAMMVSGDYRERFAAEYWQAKIRYDKLDALTVRYEAGTLNFTPDCSLALLKEQKMYMGNYIRTLKIRAEIEKIDLNGVQVKEGISRTVRGTLVCDPMTDGLTPEQLGDEMKRKARTELAEALEAEGLIHYETKDSLLYAIVTVDRQGGSL